MVTRDETAQLTLRIEAQTARFDKQLKRLEGTVRQSTRRIERSFDTTFSRLNNSVSLRGLTSTLAALGVGVGLQEIIDFSDSWVRLTNRLIAAGTPMEDVNVRMDQLVDIANRSRSSLDSTVVLYSKLSMASKELALSQEEVARATETVQKALQVGGATASESASATLQLAQGLSSGVLQGDELRAIRENSRVLAQAIADEFGVAVGDLKGLGEQGVLTSDRVAKALLAASKDVDKAFEGTTKTIGQAFQKLYNELQRFVGNSDEFRAGAERITAAINEFAEDIETFAPKAAAAAAGLAAFLAAGAGVAAFLRVASGLLALGRGFQLIATGATGAAAGIALLGTALRTLLPITAAIGVAVSVFQALSEESDLTGAALQRMAEGAKDLNALEPLLDELRRLQEAYTDAVARHAVEQTDATRNAVRDLRTEYQLKRDMVQLEYDRAVAAREVSRIELDARKRAADAQRQLLEESAQVLNEGLAGSNLDTGQGPVLIYDEETNRFIANGNRELLKSAGILEDIDTIASDLSDQEADRLAAQRALQLAVREANVEYRQQTGVVRQLGAAIKELSDIEPTTAVRATSIRQQQAAADYQLFLKNIQSKTKSAFDGLDIDVDNPTAEAQAKLENLVRFAEQTGRNAGQALGAAMEEGLATSGTDFFGPFTEGQEAQRGLLQEVSPETLASYTDLINRFNTVGLSASELRQELATLGANDDAFLLYTESLLPFIANMADAEEVTARVEKAQQRMADVFQFGGDAVNSYTDRLRDGVKAFTDSERAAGRLSQINLANLRRELEYANEQLDETANVFLPAALDAISAMGAADYITAEQEAQLLRLAEAAKTDQDALAQLLTEIAKLDTGSLAASGILAGLRNIATQALAALGVVRELNDEVIESGGGDRGSYIAERERELSLSREQAALEQQIASERAAALREGVELTNEEAEALARTAIARREAEKRGGAAAPESPIADLQREILLLNERKALLLSLNPAAADYTAELRAAAEAQRLITQLQQQGVPITEEVRAAAAAVADSYVTAQIAVEQIEQTHADIVARAEEWRETSKDASSGFVKDMIAGKSAAEALAGALQKVADKLVDIALNSAFDALFPSTGSSSGGGGFWNGIKSFFGFADGGFTGRGGKYEPAGIVHKGEYVMDADTVRRIGVKNLDRLRGYANGGLVGAPSLPGSIMGGSRFGGDTTVNIQNYSGGEVTQRTRRDGNRQIVDVVIGEVQNQMAQGRFDKTLSSRFGTTPRLIGR